MEIDELSDDVLVKQAGEGDRRAAAQLVRRHSHRVHGLAYRMTNNVADAEEITQDAFLRVWKHARKWKPGKAKFSTWLHKVTMNLCLDRLRKPKMANSDNLPEMHDQSAGPEHMMEAEQRAKLVRDALGEISERQRAALTLCYFEGLSNIEAADVLDVSVEAIESLLSRGRRVLRGLLADQKGDLLFEGKQGIASGFEG
jgi:RNA polymerase sigma-70 factor (ECF subfamily)